jgi:chromosome segregation ATPase
METWSLGVNFAIFACPTFSNPSGDFAFQELMIMFREKSKFLQREWDVWMALREKKAAQKLAEDRLSNKCNEAADLHRQCTDLEAEAREAQTSVATLEKKVDDLSEALVREAQERSAVKKHCQSEVIWVETLLTYRD